MTKAYNLSVVMDCGKPASIFDVTSAAELYEDELALCIILCDDAEDIIDRLFAWHQEIDQEYGLSDTSIMVTLDQIKHRSNGHLDQLVKVLEVKQ